MTDLTQKKCQACEGDMPPLTREEAAILLRQIPEWTVSGDGKWLSREFAFKNFKEAMGFANRITVIAEEEGHHPDLEIGWGKARVKLTTHAIGGLSENDFILAAKIQKLIED